MGNEAELGPEMGNEAELSPEMGKEAELNPETSIHHIGICLTSKLSEARMVIASEVEHPNSKAWTKVRTSDEINSHLGRSKR